MRKGRFVITDVTQLESFLSTVVHEAVGKASEDVGYEERQKQKKMSELDPTLKAGVEENAEEVDEAEDEQTDEEEVPSADVKKPSEAKVATADLKDIVKTLNIIRSGRSTKDPEVKKALDAYVKGLTSGEQQSLYAFLSGLAEMMVGGEEGKDATDPQQVGLKTKPIKADEKVKVDVKTKVMTKNKPAGEDTPIVVGERANKAKELSRIHELMRG